MDLKEIGHRIKKARKMAQLTQEELAELIDVSPHYIYEIERGSKAMSLQTLEKIAVSMHQSLDYLFWGDSIPYNANAEAPISKDRLADITEDLTPEKRAALADILAALIPHLKL